MSSGERAGGGRTLVPAVERLQGSPQAADWPLVGRGEEMVLLRRLRSRSRPLSVVLSGPAGVGKSRIARETLAEAAREGWATLVVRGSPGFSEVPLGPFRTVFQLPGPLEPTELTDSVAQEMIAMRSAKGLLVLVDDCQDLDEASSALLHQVVSAGLIVAIMTARSGTHPPVALTKLWKDGFAERVELQNLSRRETTELLGAGLGGPVQDSSANRIWNVTAGNPLYLREVVQSSTEMGALRQVDGEWRWRGEWAAGARIQEIVAERLGRLDPDELAAMEMLAVAGSLPLGLVVGLTTSRAVQALEARALVTTERSGRRLEVSIGHRLHAEVLRGAMPALQQRSIRHNLVGALTATGARRNADRVRLACWSLASGVEVDLTTLTLGTNASLFGIAHAISARLNEIVPFAAIAVPDESPAVQQDHEVAVSLAQAAFDRSGGVVEGVALASALAWTGATASAEDVLAELARKADAIDDRLRLALALAWVRFWGQSLVDEAQACLTEAARAGRKGGDPLLRGEVFGELAGIALNTAQPAAALAYAVQSAEVQGLELSQCVAAAPAAAALVYLGRCREAIALVDEAVPVATESGHPLSVANLLFARAGALARMGELEQARELMEWLRDLALSRELQGAAAVFGVLLGEILLRQGRPASASKIFRDSVGLMAERDVMGYRPWALSGLARARALSGESASASVALDEARRTQPMPRFFDISRYLAEMEIKALAGRSDEAERAAREGVAWARNAGMIGDEAQALDAWFRIAPSSAIAERLEELRALTDSELVGVLAESARATLAQDADALLAAGERFAGMATWWMATEAAAEASRIFERRHQAKAAKAAAVAAARYAEECEGEPRSASDVLAGPARLTKREHEIAALAAGGSTTREIAERMYLSPRTVENHLYHVYVKLGVRDRATLAAALAPAASPEPGASSE